MKNLLKSWRMNGIRIACFLDDGLETSRSYNVSLQKSNVGKIYLKNLGLGHLLPFYKITMVRDWINLKNLYITYYFYLLVINMANPVTSVAKNIFIQPLEISKSMWPTKYVELRQDLSPSIYLLS